MSRAFAASCALLLLCIVAALTWGRYAISLPVLADGLGLTGKPVDPLVTAVIWNGRVPRLIGAMLVGAGLATAGASFQGLFRNPLVAPDLLGVLAGSGFGAALAILWHVPTPARMAMTFAGGVAAVLLATVIGRLFAGRDAADDAGPLLLVFGGIVSGALFTALLSLTKYVADPENSLPDIVFWLLGSLTQVDMAAILIVGPVLALGIAALVWSGPVLDLLVLSDDEALSLGIPVRSWRLAIIAVATAVCALTVALAGTIGWVGLVIPHVARLLVGPAHRRLLPLSMTLGAAFLLCADTAARSLTVSEIPIGIVTDLVGVAAFLAVLPRMRRGWA
jgi:iron complex transport system permease protein